MPSVTLSLASSVNLPSARAIDKLEREMNKSLSPNLKKQLPNFYTEALARLVLDYFQHRDEYDRNELIKYTLFILQASIPNIIKEAEF